MLFTLSFDTAHSCQGLSYHGCQAQCCSRLEKMSMPKLPNNQQPSEILIQVYFLPKIQSFMNNWMAYMSKSKTFLIVTCLFYYLCILISFKRHGLFMKEQEFLMKHPLKFNIFQIKFQISLNVQVFPYIYSAIFQSLQDYAIII